MKLVLVISSLNRGGAEGVLARLANGLVQRGHEVTILTLQPGTPQYALESAIRVKSAGGQAVSGTLPQALANNCRRILALRRSIKTLAPDVVVSFMDTTNVLTLLAVGKALPVIVSERIHPGRYAIGTMWSLLRKWTYGRAAGIVVQTRSIRDCFPPALHDRIRIIPNAVPPLAAPPGAPVAPIDAMEQAGRRVLVAMGRLDKQKGFDMLLQAFAQLGPHLSDWTLTIYGEGKERAALEAMRNHLQMGGRVSLPGRVQNPQEAFAAGGLFVLSSRFEGFPNALLEAMACGLPAVAFDCPSGPADIIRHGEDGWLVPPEDIPALAQTLDRVMSTQALRCQASIKAREVTTRFDQDMIHDLWENCLGSALALANKR